MFNYDAFLCINLIAKFCELRITTTSFLTMEESVKHSLRVIIFYGTGGKTILLIHLVDDTCQNQRVLIQSLSKLSVKSAISTISALTAHEKPSVRGAAIAARLLNEARLRCRAAASAG